MTEENQSPIMSLTPYVIEDTGRGERSMDIYSRILKDRIIFIGTGIDDQVANVVVAQLLFLQMEDHKKPISIYINSPGGVISAGLAIYDTMQLMEFEINTYCIGQAASMAAVLLCAGTTGKRFALPNSRMMIHQPLGAVTGSQSDIAIQAKEVGRTKNQMAEIISSHSKKTKEEILALSERDFYMSAEEALEIGLVDEIVKTKKS
jgi:ATP-dependent Clp protease, protease subunit